MSAVYFWRNRSPKHRNFDPQGFTNDGTTTITCYLYFIGLKQPERRLLVTEWRQNLTDYGRIVEFEEGTPLENHLMGTIFPDENPWILDFPKGLQVRHWAGAFEVCAEVFYRNR